MSQLKFNHGNVHKDLGDLQQVKQCHEQALDIRIEQLGSHYFAIATSYKIG